MGNSPKTAANATGPLVGIPRALHAFEYYPFFAALLEELGCRVKLSPPTSKRIKEKGESLCTGEPCFADKVAFGHVHELLYGEKVDFVLLPALILKRSLIPAAGRLPGLPPHAYICPYAQALPYMARAIFLEDRERILGPTFHFMDQYRRRRETETMALARVLGRRCPRRRAREILERAQRALNETQTRLLDRGREVLAENARRGRVLFVLLGRMYNTCDPGLNAGVPRLLAERGYDSLSLDMLDLDPILRRPEFAARHGHTYWLSHQRLLAGAWLVRETENLRAVFITNFACGPDSFVHKEVERVAGKSKMLTITVDSQDAEANVITRLEAFLNTMAHARPPQAGFHGYGSTRTHCLLNPREPRLVVLPKMCDHAHVMAAVLRRGGTETYVLQDTDAETLETGALHTQGNECFPCVTTTGDIFRAALSRRIYLDRPHLVADAVPPGRLLNDEQGRVYVPFDPAKVAFFQGTAQGPCRYGQYLPFQYGLLFRVLDAAFGREAAEALRFCTLDADNNYRPEGAGVVVGTIWKARAWKAIRALDHLLKAVRLRRVREKVSGTCDQVYEEMLARLVRAVETGGRLLPVMEQAAARLRAVDVFPEEEFCYIQMVGEIYVRQHEFSNQNVIRALERKGIGVVNAPLGTWLKYVNADFIRQSRDLGRYRDIPGSWAQLVYQERTERALETPLLPLVGRFPDPTIAELFAYGKKYFSVDISGEAVLSVAEIALAPHHGFDGALNVMPFTCIPSNIVKALCPLIEAEHPEFPIAHFEYDGTDSTAYEENFETFVYQVRHYAAGRERSPGEVAAPRPSSVSADDRDAIAPPAPPHAGES